MNIRWLMLILLSAWAVTCGQKGPLELPPGNGSHTLMGSRISVPSTDHPD